MNARHALGLSLAALLVGFGAGLASGVILFAPW